MQLMLLVYDYPSTAISLPEIDTAMPMKPAIVNNTAGEGSQAGDPACAAVIVRNVKGRYSAMWAAQSQQALLPAS